MESYPVTFLLFKQVTRRSFPYTPIGYSQKRLANRRGSADTNNNAVQLLLLLLLLLMFCYSALRSWTCQHGTQVSAVRQDGTSQTRGNQRWNRHSKLTPKHEFPKISVLLYQKHIIIIIIIIIVKLIFLGIVFNSTASVV
jgi:hypothetical protein